VTNTLTHYQRANGADAKKRPARPAGSLVMFRALDVRATGGGDVKCTTSAESGTADIKVERPSRKIRMRPQCVRESLTGRSTEVIFVEFLCPLCRIVAPRPTSHG